MVIVVITVISDMSLLFVIGEAAVRRWRLSVYRKKTNGKTTDYIIRLTGKVVNFEFFGGYVTNVSSRNPGRIIHSMTGVPLENRCYPVVNYFEISDKKFKVEL